MYIPATDKGESFNEEKLNTILAERRECERALRYRGIKT
jgi:hypothetical protein